MKMLTSKLFFILLAVLHFSFSIKAQDEPYWRHGIEIFDKSGKELFTRHNGNGCLAFMLEGKFSRIQTLWDEIGKDLKIDKNDFAGTYIYSGAEEMYFLRWSSNKGFVLINCNKGLPDTPPPYINGFAYGKVKIWEDTEITLIPTESSLKTEYFKKLPIKWLAVAGDLVPFEELKEFGLFRAGLGRWNAGNYNYLGGYCCGDIVSPYFTNFRADGNEKFKLGERNKNIPIPKQFKPFQQFPIQGKILSVGKKRVNNSWDKQTGYEAIIIPVTINIGKKDGVWKNMLFLLPIENQFLKVTKVNLKTSEGIIVRILPESGKEFDILDKPFPPVKVGNKITTSRFD